MRNKTKKTLKGIGLGVLGVATLIGAAATINHFKADEDGLVKVHLNYDIGGLDSNGEYEETNESIYTKKAFEAQGLKVEVDFDSTINYEVFFYDEYGDFISSTGALEKKFDGELPRKATHARIEITPQEDEDGVKWYEKNGYASQLTIKVNEKQEGYVERNFWEIDSELIGKEFKITDGVGTYIDNPTFYNSKWFDVEPGQTYLVGIKDTFVAADQVAMMNFVKKDGTNRNSAQLKFNCTNSGEILWAEMTIPEDCVRASLFANNASGTYQDFIINLK